MPYQKPPKTCPVCEREAKFNFIQDFKRIENGFSLYECSRCQVQFWIPMKNPGRDVYGAQRRIVVLDKIRGGRRLSWWHKEFIKFFKNQNNQSKKLLDIGCGTGEFLNAAQKIGFDVWGVDFARNTIKLAKSFYNLKNLYAESWEDFSQRKNLTNFDVITFFEVIEHLDDIPKFLRFISKIASPETYIVLSTPNRERKSLVADFSDDFPPGHLTRWDYASLLKVFNLYGIKLENKIYGGDIDHFIGTCFRFNVGRKINSFSQNRTENILLKFFLRFLKFFINSNFYYNLARTKNTLFIPLAWVILKIKNIFNINPLTEEEKPYFLLIGKIRK